MLAFSRRCNFFCFLVALGCCQRRSNSFPSVRSRIKPNPWLSSVLAEPQKIFGNAWLHMAWLLSCDPGWKMEWVQSGISAVTCDYSFKSFYKCPRSIPILNVPVANKWILSYDQMFHPNFKCSTDPDEIIEMTVNGRPISEFYWETVPKIMTGIHCICLLSRASSERIRTDVNTIYGILF